MSLDIFERFPLRAPITAEIERPSTLVFAVTLERLLEALDGDRERRAFVVLDLDGVRASRDYSVLLFVGKDDATRLTPPSDPHFAGAFAFFFRSGFFCPPPGGEQLREGVELTRVLRGLGRAGEGLDQDVRVTVVLLPYEGREPENRTMSVPNAEIATFLSSVG